jgi:hypothetical protein
MGFVLGGSVLWGFLYMPPEQYVAQHPADRPSPDREHKTLLEKTQDDPVAFFTLCLVAFTAVLAGSTIGLWWVTWQSGMKWTPNAGPWIAEVKV